MCRAVLTFRAGASFCAVFFAVFIAAFFSACSDSNSRSTRVDEISEDDVPKDTSKVDSQKTLPFVGGAVMFTEVDPVNLVYDDHEGDDDGWVELFNTSADTVNLSGMYLTDSKSEPFKWKFGNAKIAPNSFLLVFMSGKNYPDYVLPHDTLNMIGPGCWTWTDAQSDPPGES